MKLIDISMTIHEEVQVYGNREKNRPSIKNVRNYDNSDGYETEVTYNLHTATHLDRPLHMIENGKDMDTFDIERIFDVNVKVLDLSNLKEVIRKEDVLNYEIKNGDFILFKTISSYYDEFLIDFPYIHKDLASYLYEIGISGVGIDSLGIERAQKGHPSHKTLLSNDIVILEGLRLKDVEEGEYKMYALPIKFTKTEASSVRAVLVAKE